MNLSKIVPWSPIAIFLIIGLINYVIPAFLGYDPFIPIDDFLTVSIGSFAAVEGFSTFLQYRLSEKRFQIEDARNELEKAYGPLYSLVNKQQPFFYNKLLISSEEKKELDRIIATYPFMFTDNEIYNLWQEKIQNIEQENMRDPPTKAKCIVTLGEFNQKLNEEYESKVTRYNKLLKK